MGAIVTENDQWGECDEDKQNGGECDGIGVTEQGKNGAETRQAHKHAGEG